MTASRTWFSGGIVLLVAVAAACELWPRPDASFEGSFDFPTAPPTLYEPWKALDFKAEPERYLETVYRYVLEHNVDAQGAWKTDSKRWFHVRGFEGGAYGRESLHGLTRERSSRPKELHAAQTHCAQNWAVGIYNEMGAYTLGQVSSEACPSEAAAPRPDVEFLEGAVAAKLLFTSATVQDVPYLDGAYEWQAVVHRDRHLHGDTAANAFHCRAESAATDPACRQATGTLRLVQFDLAIKDSRSETGWVFGTFVYDGSRQGATAWDRMRPLGLSWGDELEQQQIPGRASFERLGCQGRLNGPVDSPRGSCMSCHGRAVEPYAYELGAAPACETAPALAAVATAATPPRRSLDFSLQLAMGRARHCNVPMPTSTQPPCTCEGEHAGEPVAAARP